jgi:ring-1,2-phenylacetyl-CoA epoxidase subunit PaaC
MSPEHIDVHDLSGETAQALKRLVLRLADSKRLMGIRYSDWLLGAPTLETGIAASSMAQDEWGHARLLYAMLKDLGEDPVVIEHERPDEAYSSIDALDVAFPDWAAVVAGMVVVDRALAVALEAFSNGLFEPARTRVPKMISEEEFHRSLGDAWYRRLATADSEEATGLLRAASISMLPSTLAWLAAGDEAGRAVEVAGITAPGERLVDTFRDATRGLLELVGVEVDAVAPADKWDPLRGRGPGQPDSDALERARGDRNRMLFVE